MVFYKVLWQCPQVDNAFKDYEIKFHLQNSKVIKSMSKIILNHLLLSITFNDKFEDLNLIFYIWVFNTTIKVIMEKKLI